jgi:hypothetical protein
MNKGDAARIISRRLNLNLGRTNALLVAASDAGVLPKGCGRSIPQLSSLELAHLLLACLADKGIGVAGQSVREFAALRSASGAVLFDLIEGWMSGAVSVSGLHSAIIQLDPASVSIISDCGRLTYGPERDQAAAAHVITVPGTALREIVNELRDVTASVAAPNATIDRASASVLALAANPSGTTRTRNRPRLGCSRR